MRFTSIILLVAALALLSATGRAGLSTNYTNGPKTIPSITGTGLPAMVAGTNIGPVGNEYKSEKLYTQPSPTATGGISFTASIPVISAYAVPQNNQYDVYRGTVDASKNSVSFSGLPIARYDLMLVCANTIYEGYCLNRDEDSLTPEDIKSINTTIGRCIPFFDLKRTMRAKGTTGKAGKATVVLQEMRIDNFLNQNGDFMKGHQLRSIKLAFCEDVGTAGWQLLQTREIIRDDVFPDKPHGPLPFKFVESLEGIRVTTSVKDLGQIVLP